MKKFYVFAAVAIAVLASCTKSEVVYNQGQQEIGFRQFTGSMTKADPSTSPLPTTTSMGVFSYLTNPTNTGAAYFENAEFVNKSGTTKWGGKTPYYWPLQDNVDFVLYAPHQSKDSETKTPSYTPGTKTLKVTITDNSGETQTDYLYGKDFYVNTAKPATPSNGVPVVLKHALSKVTIAAKANEASIFTVSSIKLFETTQEGSYTVTYSTTGDDFTSVVTGSAEAEKKDMEYVSSAWNLTKDFSEDNTASKFVVPSAQTSIVLEYKMKGSDTKLTATVNLASESAKWETGKHYTYNLTLTADEILFDPKVEDWDNQTASEPSVNK